MTTLVDALRRDEDLIDATKICNGDEFVHQES